MQQPDRPLDLEDVPAVVDGGAPAPIPARIPVPMPKPGDDDFATKMVEYDLWATLFAHRAAVRQWDLLVTPPTSCVLHPNLREPYLWNGTSAHPIPGWPENEVELCAKRMTEMDPTARAVMAVGEVEKVARWVVTLPGGTVITGPWETVPMREKA